jgi:hypothetical protein
MNADSSTVPPEPTLPPQPEMPISSDCCGGGCADCVFTLYSRDLREWEREVKEIRRQHAEKLAAANKNTPKTPHPL